MDFPIPTPPTELANGAKYRKKPVVIDAIQWTGNNWPDVCGFIQDLCGNMQKYVVAPETNSIAIETLEGTMTASVGDWIIRGVKGELYPCKPDIFEATYEAA